MKVREVKQRVLNASCGRFRWFLFGFFSAGTILNHRSLQLSPVWVAAKLAPLGSSFLELLRWNHLTRSSPFGWGRDGEVVLEPGQISLREHIASGTNRGGH